MKNLIQLGLALAFLLICYLLAYFTVGNELLVPSLSDCVKEAGRLLISGGFWRGLSGSVLRALCAFLIAFVFAGVFAVIAYLHPAFFAFFAPIVSALRSMPVLAVLLILLSFLGAGEAPVAVAFLSLFPMLYAGVLAALSGIDKQFIEISRVCGTPAFKRVFCIYLPLSAPYVLREAGAALSFSLKLIVSAEILANTARSLGGMMQDARIYSVPQLFALVCVTSFVGLLLETSVSLIAEAVGKNVK